MLSRKRIDNLQQSILSTLKGVLERPSIGAVFSEDLLEFEHNGHKYMVTVTGPTICSEKRHALSGLSGPRGEVVTLGVHRCPVDSKPLFFQLTLPVTNMGKLRKSFLVLGKKLQHRDVYDIMTA